MNSRFSPLEGGPGTPGTPGRPGSPELWTRTHTVVWKVTQVQWSVYDEVLMKSLNVRMDGVALKWDTASISESFINYLLTVVSIGCSAVQKFKAVENIYDFTFSFFFFFFIYCVKRSLPLCPWGPWGPGDPGWPGKPGKCRKHRQWLIWWYNFIFKCHERSPRDLWKIIKFLKNWLQKKKKTLASRALAQRLSLRIINKTIFNHINNYFV